MATKLRQALSKHYRPGISSQWKGRKDGFGPERFHERIQCFDLQQELSNCPQENTWAFLGFACDEGVRRNLGRTGSAQGPDAIRRQLAPLPAPEGDFIAFYDVGDIICSEGNLEEAQSALSDAVYSLLSLGIRPIVLGGGHEVAWGNYRGIAAAYPTQDCAIVNFDSHLDLSPLLAGGLGTSGTSFGQIAIERMAKQLKFDYSCLGVQKYGNTASLLAKAHDLNSKLLFADEFHIGGIEASLELVDDLITRTDIVYVSICLDVFASVFAPGVSTPQPLGIFPWHVIPALRRLAASNKVVSLDVAELCPSLDLDGTTAKLAACLISDFIHHTKKNRPLA